MSKEKRSKSKKQLPGFTKGIGLAALFVVGVMSTTMLIRLFAAEAHIVLPDAPVPKVAMKAQAPTQVDIVQTQEQGTAYITEIEDASSEMAGEWLGVCPKNSIHSVEDFQRTVENDPVLSNHFSGFDWGNATLGKQDEDIFVFVSHRKGAVIKQTSKPIKLPKGDGYITDGARIARTYCCNDINITPSAGVPKKTPPPGPPPSIVPLEKIPLTVVAPSTRTTSSFHDPIPKPLPRPIPEPGTILLMGMGLVVLSQLARKRNPANKSERVK